MYEYLDEVLKRLVVQIRNKFARYRLLSFDELNIAATLRELYEALDEINRLAYLDIANYYYRREGGEESNLNEKWLSEVLRTPSRVMKYAYDREAVRKRDRLVESMIATSGSVAEIDKAMRYWVQMSGWFAVEVADKAVESARQEQGVDLVMWVSEHDDKVCSECHSLDGLIFDLDDLPDKPHPNCRCYTESVGASVL